MKIGQPSGMLETFCAGGGGTFFLCITDSNTTGAVDIGDDPTPWASLTKGDGFSNKPSSHAAGAFGIGKFASFVSTDLRTVLYATAFKQNGEMRHRFQGKTILVSHQDQDDSHLRSIGYFGNGFDPLVDREVPQEFRLNNPGTALYIPYYRFKHMRKWVQDSTRIVLDNFFFAIIHGGLEVYIKDRWGNIQDRTITKSTIAELQRELPDNRKARLTNELMQVATCDPVASKTFDDIGDISIRIKVDQDAGDKVVALVRDAGMLITSDRQNLFKKIRKFPQYWPGFVAIIECKSQGKGLLRQAESPRHDHISVGNIRNSKMEELAESKFRELGNWCFEVIERLVGPTIGNDTENIGELADYLGIGEGEEPGNPGKNSDGPVRDPVVTTPERIYRPPRKPTIKRSVPKYPVDVPDPVDVPPDPPDDPRPLPDNPRPLPNIDTPPPKIRRISQRFVGIRFKAGSSSTHSIVATFDRPEGSPTHIQLLAIGEDGRSYSVGIMKVRHGDELLPVQNDQLVELPHVETERQSIEIFTRVPIQDKSFDLRFIKRG